MNYKVYDVNYRSRDMKECHLVSDGIEAAGLLLPLIHGHAGGL